MVRNNLVTGWLSDSIVTLDHRLRGLEIGALDSVSKPFKAGAVSRLRAQRPLCGLAQVNDLTVQRSRCSPLRLTRGLKQQPTRRRQRDPPTTFLAFYLDLLHQSAAFGDGSCGGVWQRLGWFRRHRAAFVRSIDLR